MSILLSGDLNAHKSGQPESITKKKLLGKYRDKYDGIKYHIILGDAGFLWSTFGTQQPFPIKNEEKYFQILAERKFPTLCVIGDRDPILAVPDVREEDIGIGEKVLVAHEKKPFVAYLKRGKVYTIDGFKFLVLGGALYAEYFVPIKSPTDLFTVVNQYWAEDEKQNLFKLLETENTFDFVLSHTGPQRVNKLLFGDQQGKKIPEGKFNDEVAFMNDKVDEIIQCRGWWCGHWHESEFYFDETTKKGYQYLYGRTNLLERTEAGMKVYDGEGKENPDEMNLAFKRSDK